MTNRNFWQRCYSLPKIIVIIAVMLAVTGIAYAYASNIISDLDMTQEELQDITNENLKYVMQYMMFFIWTAFALGTTISGIIIYLFCMFNPKRHHKKTQS